eukprot:1196016-Prorocentrum_minimum.AAC.4
MPESSWRFSQSMNRKFGCMCAQFEAGRTFACLLRLLRSSSHALGRCGLTLLGVLSRHSELRKRVPHEVLVEVVRLLTVSAEYSSTRPITSPYRQNIPQPDQSRHREDGGEDGVREQSAAVLIFLTGDRDLAKPIMLVRIH